MNPKAEELTRRTRKCLLEVIALVRTFPKTLDGEIIGRQLVRAAAGVAGNYRSSCRARSHAEFTAKIGVVLDESDESELWLSVVRDAEISKGASVERLRDEAMQFIAIFYQSSVTAKSRQ